MLCVVCNSLAALAGGLYFETGFQAVLLVVYNVTYSIALYSLLIFYLAIQSLLTPFQPVRKFFSVKGKSCSCSVCDA